MARDLSSGFRQGYHTFLYGYKKYKRGSGRKRTNDRYGLRSALIEGSFVTYFVQLFVHFVDYRRRILFTKLLQEPLGMPTHLCLPHCLLLLTVVDCLSASPFTNSPSLGSFANCLSLAFLEPASPLPLPVSPEISSSGLCLVLRQNRQRDRLLGRPPT